MLMEERLNRETEVQLELYITLKNQLEMAQIESVEKGKMIHVLDPSIIPVFKSSPNPKQAYMVALILGVLIGLFITISRIWYEENKSSLGYS